MLKFIYANIFIIIIILAYIAYKMWINNLIKCNNEYTDKNTVHSYLPLYDKLLSPIKNEASKVLEIGVKNGGSIKLWHDFFINADIYGCDIKDNILIHELKSINRVHLYLEGDAYNINYVNKHFKNMKFDFILDDGPHTLGSQIKFIELYLPLLNDNGILIIEDVQNISWIDKLKAATPDNYKPYIKTFDLTNNKGRYDDIVFVIDKMNKY